MRIFSPNTNFERRRRKDEEEEEEEEGNYLVCLQMGKE
jgi:hypothetical protein